MDNPSGSIADSRAIGGSEPVHANPLPAAGQIVGNYKLLDQIGAGGFSLVWRAKHTWTGDIVAIKLPRAPEFITHLRRESAIASRFQDKQVVGILEVCLENDPPFLAMPYVPGSNLELSAHAPAPEEIAAAFRRFRQIAEVVARLHEAGIVHGDLKPGNIRFDPKGVCFLLDLGLARHQVTARQATTLRASVVSVTGEKIAGTLDFMAPEVMSGSKPTAAADVYALGVILHTMLCGRPPAFGVSPATLNPYLPAGATDFLRQMLQPDPDHRMPSAGSLLPAVDAFIGAEERCLARRNGHARRLVFHRRMRTLARGLKVLAWTGFLALAAVALPALGVFVPRSELVAVIIFMVAPFAFLGFLLGVTTLNAWIMRVPEKTYKNRSGHPWWTFMMQ